MSVTPLPSPAPTDETPAEATGNTEAEQAVIAGVLANNLAMEDIGDIVRAEHFTIPVLGRVFESCRLWIDKGRLANAITLRAQYASDEELGDLGGVAYLEELQDAPVSRRELRGYAETIRDSHLRQQILVLASEAAHDARVPIEGETAESQLERLEGQLFRLAESGDLQGHLQSIQQGAFDAIKRIDAVRSGDPSALPLSTSFADLDDYLGGLYKTDLIVLASRPGMGKTALALNIAHSIALTSAKLSDETSKAEVVAFFSLEMSTEQLAGRLMSDISGVSTVDMRRTGLRDSDYAKIYEASKTLRTLPLYVDDTPNLTVEGIRSRARRLKRRQGLSLIVVDYLQLIASLRRNDNRVLEVAEMTRFLKNTAKELEVPILLLSQLSRAVEGRENHRPTLSDLRDSGAIEQDADAVLFIYRESYYLERQEPVARGDETVEHLQSRWDKWHAMSDKAHGKAEVIVSKYRHGRTGTVELSFDKAHTKFASLARDYQISARDTKSGAPAPAPGAGTDDEFADDSRP